MVSAVSEFLGVALGPNVFATRLGWVCLHSLWQALVVAALLSIALRLIPQRSALQVNARYFLAVLALVMLPILSGITFVCVPIRIASVTGPAKSASSFDRSIVDPVSLRRLPSVTASSWDLEKGVTRPSLDLGATNPSELSAARQSSGQYDIAVVPTIPLDLTPLPIFTEPEVQSYPEVIVARDESSSESKSTWSGLFSEKVRAMAAWIEPWLPLASFIWCVGVVVASLRMVAGWMLTRQLVAKAEVVSDGKWEALVERW